MLTTGKVQADVRLNTTHQGLLSVLYTKLIGVANHVGTDVETGQTAFLLDFATIPHFFKVMMDYTVYQATDFPDEKAPEIVGIYLGGEETFNQMQELFESPANQTATISDLQKKVNQFEERLDASKVQFFDYQQYHRLPGVIHLICQAINRQDIIETLVAEIADDQLFSFSKKH